MRLHHLYFPVILLSGAFPVQGADLLPRVLATDTLYTSVAVQTLDNPALAQVRQPVSLSSVAVGFSRQNYDEAPVNSSGKGVGYGFFNAETYIKTSDATITGHASYRNGKRFGVRLCEVSDPAVIYPYFTADEVGGDMEEESYSFGGSYSSHFRNADWLYGVSLDYTALQAYRKIDPRPKNTVGRLEFGAGIGRRFGSHKLVLGGEAMKYRQSNSVMFVSELGEVKIYHLNGLGSHYSRFAGASKNSSFSGWQRAVSLSLWPEDYGVYASAKYSRFTFDKILKDLNNLPLNSVADDAVKGQAGWQNGTWNVAADVSWSHRRGAENIFGDPAGNVYPELFSMATFTSTSTSAGISALWRRITSRSRLDVSGRFGWSRRAERYLGMTPVRDMDLTSVDPSLSVRWISGMSARWVLHTAAQVGMKLPLSSHLSGLSDDDSIFADGLRHDFYYLSGAAVEAGLTLGADYMLGTSTSNSLGLRIDYNYLSLRDGNTGYNICGSVVFTF